MLRGYQPFLLQARETLCHDQLQHTYAGVAVFAPKYPTSLKYARSPQSPELAMMHMVPHSQAVLFVIGEQIALSSRFSKKK